MKTKHAICGKTWGDHIPMVYLPNTLYLLIMLHWFGAKSQAMLHSPSWILIQRKYHCINTYFIILLPYFMLALDTCVIFHPTASSGTAGASRSTNQQQSTIPRAAGIFQRHKHAHHLQSSPSFSGNAAVTPVRREARRNPTPQGGSKPRAAGAAEGRAERPGAQAGAPQPTAHDGGRSRTGRTQGEHRSSRNTSPASSPAWGDSSNHPESSAGSVAGAAAAQHRPGTPPRAGRQRFAGEGASRQDPTARRTETRPPPALRIGDPCGLGPPTPRSGTRNTAAPRGGGPCGAMRGPHTSPAAAAELRARNDGRRLPPASAEHGRPGGALSRPQLTEPRRGGVGGLVPSPLRPWHRARPRSQPTLPAGLPVAPHLRQPLAATILPAQHCPLPPGPTPAAAILIQSPRLVRAGGAGTAPAQRRCGAQTTCPRGAGRGRRWGPAHKGGAGAGCACGGAGTRREGGRQRPLWPVGAGVRCGRWAPSRSLVPSPVTAGAWEQRRGTVACGGTRAKGKLAPPVWGLSVKQPRRYSERPHPVQSVQASVAPASSQQNGGWAGCRGAARAWRGASTQSLVLWGRADARPWGGSTPAAPATSSGVSCDISHKLLARAQRCLQLAAAFVLETPLSCLY